LNAKIKRIPAVITPGMIRADLLKEEGSTERSVIIPRRYMGESGRGVSES
jgi:hypothetical protein